MPLDKKTLTPGTKIVVRSLKGKTAGIVGDANDLLAIYLRDLSTNLITALAQTGATLVVVKPPRKVFGINVCRVATSNGIEGEVYWTELKSNCELL